MRSRAEFWKLPSLPGFRVLIAVWVCGPGAKVILAQDGGAAPAPVPNAVVIQKKSSFEPRASARNPYWPIGWTPGEVGPQNSTVRPSDAGAAAPIILDLPPNQFVVSSILMAEPRLAVINGREYAEGDKIKTVLDGVAVDDANIKEISDGVILIEFRKKLYRYRIRLR